MSVDYYDHSSCDPISCLGCKGPNKFGVLPTKYDCSAWADHSSCDPISCLGQKGHNKFGFLPTKYDCSAWAEQVIGLTMGSGLSIKKWLDLPAKSQNLLHTRPSHMSYVEWNQRKRKIRASVK